MAVLDPQLELYLQEGSPRRVVKAMLDWKGSAEELSKLGVRVLSFDNGIAIVEFPLKIAEKLRADDRIGYVSVSQPLHPELDVSRTVIVTPNQVGPGPGGTPVLTGTTGKGVIIAVVDNSFDVFHKALRSLDGKTRFLSIWDMSGKISKVDKLLPPAGFDVGIEYKRADIDLALSDPPPGETKEQKKLRLKIKGNLKILRSKRGSFSDGSHGTQVAGIAAGNGAAGEPAAYGKYLGIAPEADIVGVIARGEWGWAQGFRYAKTTMAKQPGVINFSQGFHDGPRLPIGIAETWAANFIKANYVAVVKSAGNEGRGTGHAQGVIKKNTTVSFEIRMVPKTGGVLPFKQKVKLELWYGYGAKDANLTVSITPPGSSKAYDIPRGGVCQAPQSKLTAAHVKSPYPGLSGVRMQLVPAAGTWTVKLTAPKEFDNVLWHAWLVNKGKEKTLHLNPSSRASTMTVPAAATGIICVGSFVTKDDKGKPTVSWPVSDFSSRGPTPDGLISLPTLVAPGEQITSAMPSHRKACKSAKPDECYGAGRGTSFAAPHVAGTVALMLETKPDLKPGDISKALTDTAIAGSPAPADPDIWGAGRVNADLAVKAVKGGSPESTSTLDSAEAKAG